MGRTYGAPVSVRLSGRPRAFRPGHTGRLAGVPVAHLWAVTTGVGPGSGPRVRARGATRAAVSPRPHRGMAVPRPHPAGAGRSAPAGADHPAAPSRGHQGRVSVETGVRRAGPADRDPHRGLALARRHPEPTGRTTVDVGVRAV